ncbi:MAG: hypothetical protein QM605_04890 [Sphingobium sp.]
MVHERAVENGVSVEEPARPRGATAFHGGWPSGMALGKAALPFIEKEG